MRRIRVLIVDDSVVIRKLLSDILSADPSIDVVGTAANGRIALAKLPMLNPDLVTLDMEMPELDGLATLPLLKKHNANLQVIMFSTLSERGAAATFDALARGASDYVTKPANVGSVAAAMSSVRNELIPKIKSLCPFHAPATPLSSIDCPDIPKPKRTGMLPHRCDAIMIGASTGGPQALREVLEKLPATFPVPIVVVQHMPALFTRQLANRLDQNCSLKVLEAGHGEVLRQGTVLIAPGDFHLEVDRQGTVVRARLHKGTKENSCRPAVDALFRSAAKVYGRGCHAVVLTGMGQDGKHGAECIVQAGGSVMAQDESSCVVWGMPRAVTEACLAGQVVPLKRISTELIRRVSVARQPALACESH